MPAAEHEDGLRGRRPPIERVAPLSAQLSWRSDAARWSKVWFDITLRSTRLSANLVSLGTAHGNPLKILLTEELDEATAKGPQTPRPERARR